MKRFQLILILLTLGSCQRVYRLEDSDFKIIPYKVGDVLIFRSNVGDVDSLTITGQGRYMDSPQSFDFNPDSLDRFFINYTYNKRKPKGVNEPDLPIFAMHRNKHNRTKVGFGLKTSDSFFHGLRYFDIDDFNDNSNERLKTNLTEYTDVIIIEPSQEFLQYSDRDYFITRLCWSKSRGLVRFDKKGKVYELVK